MRVIILICLLVVSGKAFSYTSGNSYADAPLKAMKPVGYKYQPVKEQPVVVDRTIKYQTGQPNTDPSVLISARKPMIESSLSRRYEEQKAIMQAQVIKVQAVPVEQEPEVIIKATISSDDYPEEVEYAL